MAPRHVPRVFHAWMKTAGEEFVRVDSLLDQANLGPTWLRDPRIALLLSEAFQRESDLRLFRLAEYVVMPNHVHLLLWPHVELAKITHRLKGHTAHEANRMLGREGQRFWQDESYDHWVRDEDEMRRIAKYIVNNPVKAGLVARPEEWPWSSAPDRLKPVLRQS